MAKRKKTGKKIGRKPARKKKSASRQFLRTALRVGMRAFWAVLGFQALVIFVFAFANPPTNFYMLSESIRLGGVRQEWTRLEDISPDLPRAIVAAEDANFCEHWGFDLRAIRAVVASGSNRLRGASTLSQQVAKNVFLWQGRSWVRKALEAETTLFIELFWSKRRIVEVYANVAEFDQGVFGVAAAGQHYFGVAPDKLSLLQSARLAAILPNPKVRSAIHPSTKTKKRAAAIVKGARTIEADGRDGCFQ